MVKLVYWNLPGSVTETQFSQQKLLSLSLVETSVSQGNEAAIAIDETLPSKADTLGSELASFGVPKSRLCQDIADDFNERSQLQKIHTEVVKCGIWALLHSRCVSSEDSAVTMKCFTDVSENITKFYPQFN